MERRTSESHHGDDKQVMTDREIILQYRDIVHEIHSIRQRLAWNIRHDLPVMSMPEKVNQLLSALLRFEMILDGISDRRTRNIIVCRFALGMSERDTAFVMGISAGTVGRICNGTLQSMS